jgi:hypothetical protein
MFSWMFFAKNNKIKNKIRDISKLRKLIENTTSRKIYKTRKGIVVTTTSATNPAGLPAILATNTDLEILENKKLYNN